jgi:hypothetical protein
MSSSSSTTLRRTGPRTWPRDTPTESSSLPSIGARPRPGMPEPGPAGGTSSFLWTPTSGRLPAARISSSGPSTRIPAWTRCSAYDDRPAERNFLSQFKNLLHHFVHQNADEEARTFWTGCGAIRRKEFLEAGGFSETYALPSIEDVEFGYRLKGSGKTIRLLKALQVTHLKRWTFAGLLRSDIAGRAIPWTKLACARGLPRDLNFRLSDRLSAFLAWLLPLSLAASVLRPSWVIPAAGAAILLLLINRALYRFFLKKRGPWFAAGAVFWHWLYLLYASAVFILWAPACLVKRIFGRRPARG